MSPNQRFNSYKVALEARLLGENLVRSFQLSNTGGQRFPALVSPDTWERRSLLKVHLLIHYCTPHSPTPYQSNTESRMIAQSLENFIATHPEMSRL